MERKASAVWYGEVRSGQGSLSTESGVLKEAQFSFKTRFENGIGTNPEELLAAAHAGCFAMALSAQLGIAKLTARRLDVTATITLEVVGGHHAVTKSHLDLSAHVPGATQQAFDAAVKAAEIGCPVSKLFRAAISADAQLDARS
jgi:lipoyl-dependent peroxiredoxin